MLQVCPSASPTPPRIPLVSLGISVGYAEGMVPPHGLEPRTRDTNFSEPDGYREYTESSHMPALGNSALTDVARPSVSNSVRMRWRMVCLPLNVVHFIS